MKSKRKDFACAEQSLLYDSVVHVSPALLSQLLLYRLYGGEGCRALGRIEKCAATFPKQRRGFFVFLSFSSYGIYW